MDTPSSSQNNPWFAATIGLAGLIVGYVLATGMNQLPAFGQRQPPAAFDNPSSVQPGRFATIVDAFTAYADDAGLDADQFKTCFAEKKSVPEIQKDLADGSASGISGTPGFWILGPNGKAKLISGAFPYDTFKQTFDAMVTDDKFVSDTGTPATADDDPSLGSATAPITVIEFTDFQCPFCQRHFQQTFDQIKLNYVDTGKVKYVLRDFPLGFHPHAQDAAVAANCGLEQSKYWEMHAEIFKNQTEWSQIP